MAFVPRPLPPSRPALRIEGNLADLHSEALAAIGRLEVAGTMVPSPDWFLYGFVRKEAVVSSQIEGTLATLEEVVAWEATHQSKHPADVEEVCNYVDALSFARAELARPRGLPLCTRLLRAVHKRLMQGGRGSERQPGTIRTSQNWIGGTRPGNAQFVPPPPEAVPEALAALDQWIHSDDPLPPLVRAGLAHVQFETIHPFLDGNGRIGRLLVTLLLEHWGLLSSPLLYLSLGFKRQSQSYYRHLDSVRTRGDREGWTAFFLQCVSESADDGVTTARRLFTLVGENRQAAVSHKSATVNSLRLFEALPQNPVLTLAHAMQLVSATKPTVLKAIAMLCDVGILEEVTGKRRDRIYVYRAYLDVLGEETVPLPD
ncbi:Adenosine monophosphate-protein transferase SoFic [Maioricimonas rarisocia]|uniref:Adenosine monophosphate-protein transferase SoFic n=1 Tax=Maioricimonas rarisocia TaxID=2528026 RepID=A0A517ZB52_9PLAN|nr:Fic family protein [Maioricimonas rarisocia]QDU39688.1 Adenosine monophosphate-protein transferase SoFic [Maioricimonas rarisocia]